MFVSPGIRHHVLMLAEQENEKIHWEGALKELLKLLHKNRLKDTSVCRPPCFPTDPHFFLVCGLLCCHVKGSMMYFSSLHSWNTSITCLSWTVSSILFVQYVRHLNKVVSKFIFRCSRLKKCMMHLCLSYRKCYVQLYKVCVRGKGHYILN